MLSGNNVCALTPGRPPETLIINSTHRYLPTMIGRMMLSLKKATGTEAGWSLAGTIQTLNPEGRPPGRPHSMQFAPMSDEDAALSTEEAIPLETVSSPAL